jgi:Zn-dependent protease
MNTNYILASIVPMILAITIHEAAHAYAANFLGDSTAKRMGRITLNPIPHIDPIGTLALPALTLILGGFFFGWAKPVPVDPRFFKNPKSDMMIVAAAGPLSNLLQAIIWAWIFILPTQFDFLNSMATAGVFLNLSLMALNLLPIPPLDGSKILDNFLPTKMSWQLSRAEPYGFFILIAFSILGVLSYLMSPLISIGLQIVKTFSPM